MMINLDPLYSLTVLYQDGFDKIRYSLVFGNDPFVLSETASKMEQKVRKLEGTFLYSIVEKVGQDNFAVEADHQSGITWQ